MVGAGVGEGVTPGVVVGAPVEQTRHNIADDRWRWSIPQARRGWNGAVLNLKVFSGYEERPGMQRSPSGLAGGL